MNSSYVHTTADGRRQTVDGLAGLGDATGIIESPYGAVRIIHRYPNAVKVQVQTYYGAGDFWRTPFVCPDAFVAIRLVKNNQIIGGGFVRTELKSDCRGDALIRFANYSYNPSDKIIFELYQGGTSSWFDKKTTLEAVRSGRANDDFIAASQPIRFSDSSTTIDEGGVIQDRNNTNKFDEIFNSDIGNTLKWTGIIAAGGVGLYLLMPFMPVLQDQIEDVAATFKSEKNND